MCWPLPTPCSVRSLRGRLFRWRATDMPVPTSPGQKFRCAVLSAVKHDYVARGVASHPRFELVVVADDPETPNWSHDRNQQLADAFQIPYVYDVEKALREFNVQVAIVSPAAERHYELSIRAANWGSTSFKTNPSGCCVSTLMHLSPQSKKVACGS